MFANYKPRRFLLSSEPAQRAQALCDAVLVREFEEEFEAGSHRLVKLEADVLAQVADQFRARPPELALVDAGDLLDARQPLVARARELNAERARGRRLVGHPHGEDEAEAREAAPQRGHVVDPQAFTRER